MHGAGRGLAGGRRRSAARAARRRLPSRVAAGLVLVVVLGGAAGCSSGGSGGDDDDGAAGRTTTTPPLHAEDDLADGTYFGFVTALDPARLRLVFDVAELLEGDEAVQAAAADSGVVTEGGSYVRNPDDRMNRITLADDLVVRLLKPCCELHEVGPLTVEVR